MQIQSFSWDLPSTSPTQLTKRTVWCVFGTPTTPEPRYLILSISPVSSMGDTSFTITTELILRTPMDIPLPHTMTFVKLKFMVRKHWRFTDVYNIQSVSCKGHHCTQYMIKICQENSFCPTWNTLTKLNLLV